MSKLTLVFWLTQHCRFAAFGEAELRSLEDLETVAVRLRVRRTEGVCLVADVAGVERRSAPSPPLGGLELHDFALAAEDVRFGADTLAAVREWSRLLLERSVLVRLVAVLYAEGESVEAISRDALGSGLLSRPSFDSMLDERQTFAWCCETSGRQTAPENVENMNRFESLFDRRFRADLKNPGIKFCILSERHTPPPGTPQDHRPYIHACVGRVLCQVLPHGRITVPYQLPQRPVLGPTSLDTDITFLMCNIAGVRRYDVVLDPFCGTGSILVAAARLGAVCFGADIDRRVLRGWAVAYQNKAAAELDATHVFANFDHYSLPRPDIARADNLNAPWLTTRGFADCIVTDPPYGVRATVRASSMRDIYDDLVKTSHRALRVGGRLVFLVPGTVAEAEAAVAAACRGGGFEPIARVLYEDLSGDSGRCCVSLRKIAHSY